MELMRQFQEMNESLSIEDLFDQMVELARKAENSTGVNQEEGAN